MTAFAATFRSLDERLTPDQEPHMPEPAVNPKELRAALDGKVPLDYLEPVALIAEAHVMKHGADKYGRRNYRDTPMKMSVYVGALLRHTLAWSLGEDIDPESGQPHLAHIRACCAVMLGAIDAGVAVDDRLDATSTPRSDAVHIEGNIDAKGVIPESELVARNDMCAPEYRCCLSGETITSYCRGNGKFACDTGPVKV